MTDLRKAAEMALEALESVYGKGKRCEAAIEALRQALAQPEQEPVGFFSVNDYGNWEENENGHGTPLYAAPPSQRKTLAELLAATPVDETAKGEQEPVAWMWKDGTITNDPDKADGTWQPLYTAPPKQWVGLTDADKQEAFDETQEASGGFWDFADYLEAKLKEKNT